MFREFLKSKVHRATVTQCDVDYEGSLTLDADLIRAADFSVHEKIAVWDVTNGNRFETYIIEGTAGSGAVCVNGAAAHLVAPGDILIIAAFVYVGDDEQPPTPRVVRVDGANRILADGSLERAR